MKSFKIEVKGVGVITEKSTPAEVEGMIKIQPSLKGILEKLKANGKEEAIPKGGAK